MHEYQELKEKLSKELKEYGKKDLTAGSLDAAVKLSEALINVDELICKEGCSNDGYPMDANGNYSYGRGRMYANRDTNGRYSGDGYSRDSYSWDGYSRDSRVTRQDLHRMVEDAVNERMRNM